MKLVVSIQHRKPGGCFPSRSSEVLFLCVLLWDSDARILKIKGVANGTTWFSHTKLSLGLGLFRKSLQKGSWAFVHDATTLEAGKGPAVEKPLQILGTDRFLSFVSIISYQHPLKNEMNHEFLVPCIATSRNGPKICCKTVLERDLSLSAGKKVFSRRGPRYQGWGWLFLSSVECNLLPLQASCLH